MSTRGARWRRVDTAWAIVVVGAPHWFCSRSTQGFRLVRAVRARCCPAAPCTAIAGGHRKNCRGSGPQSHPNHTASKVTLETSPIPRRRPGPTVELAGCRMGPD